MSQQSANTVSFLYTRLRLAVHWQNILVNQQLAPLAHVLLCICEAFGGERERAQFDALHRAHEVALHYSRVLRGC